MNGWLARAGGALAAALITAGSLLAAEPVLTRTAPGRFEIASVDAPGAQRAMTEAEGAWRYLSGPLDLPEAFSSSIFVRLVPATDWNEPAPFRVVAEAGGVVSVRVRWSEATPTVFMRRALVQALLVRLGVAAHGVTARLTAPLWLEQACVGWWRVQDEPAQFDALQQESAAMTPPALQEILDWQRSNVEPRALAVGAVWLLTWLRAESGRGTEWAALRASLIGGKEPAAALAGCFPGCFVDAAERELWWQVGWHQVRRARTQPQFGSAESRATLADAARLVFAVGERDAVVPLRFALRHGREPAVAAVLAARAADLQRVLPALHPFYRNAGLALAECVRAINRPAELVDTLCAEFDREWSDATDLESTAREALDALTAGRR